MRTINYRQIVDAVAELTGACCGLTCSCKAALERALDRESNDAARYAIGELLKNAELAERERLPVCQDTGLAIFFVQLGQDVHIEGGSLYAAIDEGVRVGYRSNGCRASVLDPITRVNTTDNTPASVHVELAEGDEMKIEFLAKGFGSENMSRLYMLTPSDGIDGIERAVLDAVSRAGSKPCPPIVVGVGIGGAADSAMTLAKKQLLREVGEHSDDETLRELEISLLQKINALGIGAQGFGGCNTALAVHIGKLPTHIAGLPVAVNIQCNAVRVARTIL